MNKFQATFEKDGDKIMVFGNTVNLVGNINNKAFIGVIKFDKEIGDFIFNKNIFVLGLRRVYLSAISRKMGQMYRDYNKNN